VTIAVPELSLVVLVGPSGAGKSTFARAHFRPTEIVSSDAFRAMLADDETDQSVSAGAFELVHRVVDLRLAGGRLTVVDATNVRPEARRPLIDLARRHNVPAVAVVLDVPADECHARNQLRGNRTFGPAVTRRHEEGLRRSLDRLEAEGFRRVFVLHGAAEVAAATVERTPLPNNRRALTGPFDLIGDVHGCLPELRALLTKLGWTLTDEPNAVPPAGRTAVFVGDLVDRGPDSPGVLRLVMNMAAAGHALCVLGNHDEKFLRWLRGGDVKPTNGLDETLRQFEGEPPEFRDRVREFLAGVPVHLVLNGGKLVVAHAGLPEAMHGRAGGRVRAFALYGDVTGERDEFGLPVRRDWAADYRGRAAVVYGHTPVTAAVWFNRTACLDTGCAFGGPLTALRYPEGEFVSVPAEREYAPSKRPFRVVGPETPVPPPAPPPEPPFGAGL
jgi:polynucleotide kinase-phosphatase